MGVSKILLDTGAAVNVMGLQILDSLQLELEELQEAAHVLTVSGRTPILGRVFYDTPPFGILSYWVLELKGTCGLWAELHCVAMCSCTMIIWCIMVSPFLSKIFI